MILLPITYSIVVKRNVDHDAVQIDSENLYIGEYLTSESVTITE